MRSINYKEHQNLKEEDLLVMDFLFQKIEDYTEVDWRWIKSLLYGHEEIIDNKICFSVKDGELEGFADRILLRNERVRILSFLRDNCRECLFGEEYDEKCICDFENECARLIAQNLKRNKTEQQIEEDSGDPIPDLKAIALEHFKRDNEDWEKKIIDNLPNFTIFQIAVPKDILLQIAYDFMNSFHNEPIPSMDPQYYENDLYTLIAQRSNRQLFKDFNPVYQTFFIMDILINSAMSYHSDKERTFAAKIEEYLEKHAQINRQKNVIQQKRQEIIAMIQHTLEKGNEEHKEIHLHFHEKVGQVIGNVENLNTSKEL